MSTETKHTPGPWKVGRFGGVYPDNGVDTAAIATASTKSGYLPNSEANERLIAAAPELLEALDLARKYMKLCLGSSFWDGPNPYPIIDAALAKARGEVDA